MKSKILITEKIDDAGVRYLADHGYEVKWGSGISENDLLRDIQGCAGVLIRNAVIGESILCAAPGLKVIAVHGVGVDTIDVEAATRHGVIVTNTPGANSVSVAEYTVGLLLDLAKHIPLYDGGLHRGNWEIRRTLGLDLAGKTLGIVGMGAIGSLVAKKAAAGFDMNVIAYRRTPAPCEYARVTSDLDEVLRESDFVSLHVPLCAGTAGMIGERELALMKPGAYLINTARGDVVDEAALIRALQEKRLAGAALDVFSGEVPKAGNPLLQMDNVIVTPHTAAFSAEATGRMALYAAMGVDEVLSGRQPSHAVNRLPENDARAERGPHYSYAFAGSASC